MTPGPRRDAVLVALGLATIVLILLLSWAFPTRARSDEPTIPTAVPASAFATVVVPDGAPDFMKPRRTVPEPTRLLTVSPGIKMAGSASSAPKRLRTATASISGQATWYAWRPGQAAAGPRLREALGPGWRGRTVRVCSASRCITVALTDWCACDPPSRLVDLDARSFAVIAPLSDGVIRVTVEW